MLIVRQSIVQYCPGNYYLTLIFSLTTAVTIVLHSNGITGTVPTELGLLANVHHLDLASNLLGEAIPFEIGNMVQLRKSHRLIHNYQSIHTDLISLYYHVGNLDLGVNAFRGAIPPQVAALPHLEQLRLRENRLTGTIPIVLLESGRMRTYF